MYRDRTLIPAEAIRLAALGMLAEGEREYAALARDIRHFVQRITGPSLDLLGTSLELLCYEGLAETADGEPARETSRLRITAQGRAAFHTLATANLRAPLNDVNKLVLALKLRFIDLLPEADRRDQALMLSEICDGELARLESMGVEQGSGVLADWLRLELAQTRERAAWFRALAER
ncbi:MAG: hypothetical protein AB7G39_07965 [Alphaproteobacteria bacterium]